jgi:hypothetical protein
MAQSMEDAGDAKDFVQQGFGEKEPYWDKDIKWFQFPDDSEPHSYRLVGLPFYFSLHWIATKKKDGSVGKSFSALCKNFDSTTKKYAENGCKYCEFKDLAATQLAKKKYKDWPEAVQRITAKTTMASNAIVREIQQQGAPSNNAGGWTFIQPVRFPEGFSNTIKEKTDKFNKVAGKVWGFNHKDHGRDLLITYNSVAKEKAKMYQLDIGDKTVLTPEEMAHAKYLIDFQTELSKIGYPKDENCVKALEKNGYYDLLESLNANNNLKEIQKDTAPQSVPTPVAPPPQQAPVVPPEVVAQAAAFDVPADGGVAATTGGELKAESAKADSAVEAPKFDADEPLPNFPTPTVPPAAPVQAAAPVVPPTVQPPPTPLVTTAPTVAPQGILQKIAAFASSQGLTLVPHDKEYSDTTAFRKGMSVPSCFTTYTATKPTKLCVKCPLKLDCMVADTPLK